MFRLFIIMFLFLEVMACHSNEPLTEWHGSIMSLSEKGEERLFSNAPELTLYVKDDHPGNKGTYQLIKFCVHDEANFSKLNEIILSDIDEIMVVSYPKTFAMDSLKCTCPYVVKDVKIKGVENGS